MQATISAQSLQNALDTLSKLIPGNDSVSLSADQSNLKLCYHSFEAAMFINLISATVTPGSAYCGFEKLFSVVKLLPSAAPVTLKSGTQLLISCDKHTVKIPVSDPVIAAYCERTPQQWHSTGMFLETVSRAGNFTDSAVVVSSTAVIGTNGVLFAAYKSEHDASLNGSIPAAVCRKLKKFALNANGITADASSYTMKIGESDQFITRKISDDPRIVPLVAHLTKMAEPLPGTDISTEVFASHLRLCGSVSDSATVTLGKDALTVSTDNESYSGTFVISGPEEPITFKCVTKDILTILSDITTATLTVKTSSEGSVPLVITSDNNMYVTTKII